MLYDRKPTPSQNGDSEANRGTEQVPRHAPNVPEHLQQAVAQGRRIGVFIVSYRPRLLDDDNFHGGCKPLIDSLRYAGYLKDDNRDNVRVWYEQIKCATKDERTEVYLFPL